MTITTPPQETRTRRRRREDDAAPPRRRRSTESREDDADEGVVRSRPAKSAATRTTAPKKAAPKKAAAKNGTVKARPATTTEPRRSAAPRKDPPRPAVRRSATPPRAPFVLLVVGLLGGTLVSLLLLNTVLAQDAFTLSELQRGNKQLSERKQALQEDINRENSPAMLHAKARALGMVDGQRPAFIDARTGRVTEGGARPPGVSDEAMAAAAGAGVAGGPGAIMPPAGAPAPRAGGATPKRGAAGPKAPAHGTSAGTAPRGDGRAGGGTR